MSRIWTFSPSSEPYLKQCLEAASAQETENKWSRKFGRQTTEIIENTDIFEKENAEAIESPSTPQELEENDVSVAYEDFFGSLANEPRFDLLVEECTQNPDFITKMAKHLSSNTVEKLFEHLFTSKHVKNDFLAIFLPKFVPNYIKAQYSYLCIELLVKISEAHPEIFPKVLEVLLKDTEIPNTVVNSYISMLSEEKCTNFLENFTFIDLSSECFIHNLISITSSYKNCTKTDTIQNYIKYNLVQYGLSCVADKNYGKLFMMYIQAEKALGRKINSKQLIECLDIHRSPFKKPCINLLKDIVE